MRHTAHAARRKKIWDSLCRIRTRSSKLERFKECGSGAYVQREKTTGEYRLVANGCGNRLCPACAADRGARIAASLAATIAREKPRFVTLTLRHNSLALADQISRIYNCLTALRRRRWWKQYVTGGAAVLEVKLGRDNRWHPHLHLLVSSEYLPQKQLAQEWLKVTGDSSIVDVRSVTDPATLGKYLAKYMAKPCSNSILADPDRLDEFATALKGRRLCMTFGSWRGIPLEPDNPDPRDWQTLGSFETMINRARSGDPEAQRALESIARRKPGVSFYMKGPAP